MGGEWAVNGWGVVLVAPRQGCIDKDRSSGAAELTLLVFTIQSGLSIG